MTAWNKWQFFRWRSIVHLFFLRTILVVSRESQEITDSIFGSFSRSTGHSVADAIGNSLGFAFSDSFHSSYKAGPHRSQPGINRFGKKAPLCCEGKVD